MTDCPDQIIIMNKNRSAPGPRFADRTKGSLHAGVLSAREREVMVLATKGFANKEIARQLRISEGTVKLHLHSIYRKLGIKSRFALAALVRNAS
jgi:DNA-binding NarL/FixJ family response regulator